MQTSYNTWLVALSIVVAMMVAYTALKLAARVAASNGKSGRLWLYCGGTAMGTGIWSMHFIGMLAFTVPIPLQYGVSITLASLLIAIVTSTFALKVASRAELSLRRLSVAAMIMALGICSMHYSGMAAIQITPMIHYSPSLVLASVGIALGASFAGLWLAFKLRSGVSLYVSLARVGAAAVMGLAISGMHYTAMAAAWLAPGSYCVGGKTLDNEWLGVIIGLFALGVLTITVITSIYDAHLASQTRKDAMRLAEANAALEHGKNLLSLATGAAGIFCWELDLLTQKMLWSENELQVLKRGGFDSHLQSEALLFATHADDAHIMLAAIDRAQAEHKESCSYRSRLVIKNDEVAHIETHGRIICDANGRPTRLLAVSWDITEEVLENERHNHLQRRLREASREAGMAEVATGVLHSVGNVLNSLSVSASMLETRLRNSRAGNLERITSLIEDNREQLGSFLTENERGKQIPGYLTQLGQHLASEQKQLASEAQTITSYVQHVRTIVAVQQTHAKRVGVTEVVNLAELMDSSIAMYFTGIHNVDIRRDYAKTAEIMVDRHKLMQIVGNLLTNARHALAERPQNSRVLSVRIAQTDEETMCIAVQDSGIGIEPATLKRLFEFGFTTKKQGHGFGLHSSAILAKELGGDLSAASEGRNCGACFTLRLRAEVKGQQRALA